jgi:hypothetical protein
MADVDGDGRADFGRLSGDDRPGGRAVLRCLLASGGGFAGEVVAESIDPGYAENRWLADVNGDGRADFCRLVVAGSDESPWLEVRCLLASPDGFGGEWATGRVDLGFEGWRWFGDVNGDGRADFCRRVPSAEGSAQGYEDLKVLLAGEDGFSDDFVVRKAAHRLAHSAHTECWLADFDGDGRKDLCGIRDDLLEARVTGNLIVAVLLIGEGDFAGFLWLRVAE